MWVPSYRDRELLLIVLWVLGLRITTLRSRNRTARKRRRWSVRILNAPNATQRPLYCTSTVAEHHDTRVFPYINSGLMVWQRTRGGLSVWDACDFYPCASSSVPPVHFLAHTPDFSAFSLVCVVREMRETNGGVSDNLCLSGAGC